MTWPSWTELMLMAGGIGGAVAWVDQRFGLSKEVRDLKKAVSDATAEVEATKRASDRAMAEKNRELELVKDDFTRRLALVSEDRDRWKGIADYEQERAQHFEGMVAALREGRS